MTEPVVTQTKPGRQIEFSGKRSYGQKRLITVDREWEVSVDGVVFEGTIVYRLFTREQRTPGKRYVNSRWQAPGWGVRACTRGDIECWSKKDAVNYIVRNAKKN